MDINEVEGLSANSHLAMCGLISKSDAASTKGYEIILLISAKGMNAIGWGVIVLDTISV